MILLVLLPFILVYVFLLFYVPARLNRFAESRNYGKTKRWGLTLFGFLLVYLPVFWDHIPTVIAHNYYCGKDAGLFIYKTPEQWTLENPGVATTLTHSEHGMSEREEIANGRRYLLNQRIAREVVTVKEHIGIHRFEESILDRKTGALLALYRNYHTGITGNLVGGSGGVRSLKAWIAFSTCEADEIKQPARAGFAKLEDQFKKLGSKK